MSLAIVTAASDPAFYARVAYAALKVAKETLADSKHPNGWNRAQYSNRIFQGVDNVILLAQHVATDPSIAASLEKEGPEGPTDEDIKCALEDIWDARANAFAAPPPQPPEPLV